MRSITTTVPVAEIIRRNEEIEKSNMIAKYNKYGKELDLYRTFSGRQGQQLCQACIIQRSTLSKRFFEKYGTEIFD